MIEQRLTGACSHHRECHIAQDWLYIYKLQQLS
ncbi:MAG: type II toxin-antitoxin system YafQ family toxin [Candidatus Aegiribacteria sp.]|nr:type II toxin-antitoxin system YafQ family toxin [Candidatus Aegiribacteria sp.]